MNSKPELTAEQEKFLNLIKNKEFFKELISQDSVEDVQMLFKDEGIDLTKEEIEKMGDMIDQIAKKVSNLSDEELERVIAGTLDGTQLAGGITCGVLGGIGGIAAGSAIGGRIAYKSIYNTPDALGLFLTILTGKEYGSIYGSIVGSIAGAITGGVIGTVGGTMLGIASGSVCKWKNKK